MNEEDFYYKSVQKKCKNCFWHRFSILSPIQGKCGYYPNWLIGSALGSCKMKQWIPNQNLKDRK